MCSKGLYSPEVSKYPLSKENWKFVGPFQRMTFASRMQHKIYWGPLRKPLEWSLKTILAPWAYLASVLYHDSFWYPMKGRSAMKNVLTSNWSRLFDKWDQTAVDIDGYQVEDGPQVKIRRSGLRALLTSFGILGKCLKDAPEFTDRRRRITTRAK